MSDLTVRGIGFHILPSSEYADVKSYVEVVIALATFGVCDNFVKPRSMIGPSLGKEVVLFLVGPRGHYRG